MHAGWILSLALLLTAPLSGCVVPENMATLREDLGYASVDRPDLVAKARASTLSPRIAETVTFTAEIDPKPLGNATILWTLPDGEQRGRVVEHTFTEPGPAQVQVTVQAQGVEAKDTLNLTVTENRLPSAEITVPGSSPIVAGETVRLAANALDPDGDPLTHSWAIDGEAIGQGPTIEHAFAAGVHEIRLTVDDGLASVAAFEEIAVAERLRTTGNLTLSDDVLTVPLTVHPQVDKLSATLTHSTRMGVDDVHLVLLDGDGEEVAAARTEPEPGASTGTETLTVDGDDLAPGEYTLEARLDRGTQVSVTLEGQVGYVAPG